MEGRFLWTLMATDIATGWSESLPIVMRDGAVVLTALRLIRRQLPFPLRGIDADNDPVVDQPGDGVAVNSLMEAWCDRPGQQIVLTRSRAYKSNDQAWVGHPKQSRGFIPRDCLGTPVEQKNGMLVRRVVGYQRLVSLEAAQVLGELYGALRLYRCRGSLSATRTCFSPRSSSKAANGMEAGSSDSTTRRAHRCSVCWPRAS